MLVIFGSSQCADLYVGHSVFRSFRDFFFFNSAALFQTAAVKHNAAPFSSLTECFIK